MLIMKELKQVIVSVQFLLLILTGQIHCSKIRFQGDVSRFSSQGPCIKGYQCQLRNQCWSKDLLFRDGREVSCGYTSHWRWQVCCRKESNADPSPTSMTTVQAPPVTPNVPPPANVILSSCGRDYSCQLRDQCFSRDLLLRDGREVKCGYSPRGKRKVCCKRVKAIDPLPPIPVPTMPQAVTVPPPKPTRTFGIAPGNIIQCGKAPGHSSYEGYMIGGTDATQGAWPWMAAITIANRDGRFSHLCTGFLIDKRHVLSAAHCFRKRQVSLYRARIGHVDQTLADEYTVTRIIIPQQYKPGQFYDDIAMLTLSRPVDTPDFTPVCLPWDKNFVSLAGQGTTVVGWGATTPRGPINPILQQLSAMPVVENEVCERIFLQRHSKFNKLLPRGLTPGFVCAGYLDEEAKGTCGSDAGDPLLYMYKDRWYAVGVQSFGFLCGEEGPQAFTKITKYLDWINDNLND